ncbi:unnamed protein product [Bursaphelenchus okinawaensis]|uniref:Rap-GAP domain-containing protein n=1 Tax=Bursaphelenchus okinawaensis TaxID=465554 RepID=A0A811KC74_9BILA|nr:unnamed protein product [Bursaphelenchus okinawaensis]CAG9099081.1 unnamed protein product [Bursaphelenchus okinawaensis]
MSTDGPVSRRSFAGSANSASDISQHNTTAYSNSSVDPSTIPAVDGVSAGKSAAIGALCRIVCSKSSNEVIPEEQMAQFLVVLHEALVERDRLMLCSLVFYSTELFKLGLNGVEILLPNYVTAIDILLTESFKLRLHPSINEIDMRHSCLRALASVIAWPTTFGQDKITAFDEGVSLTKGNNNVLGVGMKYDELRPRILRTLVYALRNETDSMNLQLALGLCHSFCAENANYEIESLDEEKVFAVSALRQTISAVCDNLCKPQWCAELGTSLAAFDCLNALSTLPTKLLFYEGDHSTGTLILSSLCRFVNSQLQKPPPFHSRDLHSSVVAAFQSLEVWLCAAPILAEVESVISTVANTVEFGMTGGTGLSTEQYKPASQRVHDAAESLHYTLFGSVGANDCMTMVDEHSVIRKLGDDNVSLKGFQHFIVDKFSLLSVHNLTHADFVSNGQPTVVMVCRTPYQPAHATLVQLKSRVEYDENADVLNNNRIEITDKNGVLIEKVNDNQETAPKPPKHKAEIPAECFKIECELDKNIQQKPPTDQSKQVEDELSKIRKRLAEGAVSPLSDRDQKNVWSTASLDSELCASPKPAEPFKKCNAVRVFLYDMGLLDRKTFGQDLIALDSTHTTDFFDALHCQIDRQPAKKCETVSIFYVRRGQRSFSEILKNTEHLETTSKSFVGLISRLGRIRRTREPGFWTGHWQTAFSPPPSLDSDPFSRTSESESHSLDGLENCIWWSDSQLEIAYQLPSERSLQRNLQYIHGDVKEDSYSVPAKQVTINCLQLHINVGEAMVKVNRPQISPSQRLLIHQDNLLPVDDSESIISDYNDTIHKRNMMASLGSTVSIHPGMLSIDVGPTPGSTEPPRSARFSPTARARILARQKTVDYTRYTTPENTTRKTSDSALNKNMSLQMSVAPNTLITNRPNIDNEYENEDGSRYRTAGRNSVGHYDTERQDTAGSNPVRRYEKLHGTAGKSESVRQYDTETLKAADQDTLKHYDKGIQRRYTSPSTNSIDSMGLSSPSDRASTGIASPNDSPRNRAQTNPRYEKVRDRQYSKSSKYDRYFENDLSLTASQKRTGLAQLGTATQNKSTSSPKSKLQMAASPKNKWKMAAEIGLQESRNAKMASGQNLKLTSPTSQTSKESPSSQSSTTTPASPTTSKTKPTKPATPTPLTQQSSFSYIKSFFKRKNTEDSAGGSFAKPEPMLKTLSEVTEEELEEMFPRMPSQSSKEQKGYTPSSTSSSLAPHSREGSSLTDDSGAVSGKRSSDLSQPTAATRTRSTSTVNSECGSTQKLGQPSNQARTNGTTPKRSPDQRVLVVWLEKIEDLHHFPYEQLLMATDDGTRRMNQNLKSLRADLHLIYLHNFEEGLVQVHTEAIWTKAGQPGPLVDGIVVSVEVLPALLRQTVANISRRKAVEVDQTSPYQRRRQAIAEVAKKYGCKFGYTEFLDRFITNDD